MQICIYMHIYGYRIAFSFPLSLQILRKLASAMTQKILKREEFWLVLFSVSSVACFWFQAECVLCSGGCPTSSLLQPNLQVLLPSQPSSCKTIALSSAWLPILFSFGAFFILHRALFLSLNVLYFRFSVHSFERAHLISIFEIGKDLGQWWQYLDISCLWDFETSKLLSLFYQSVANPSTQIPSWNISSYS